MRRLKQIPIVAAFAALGGVGGLWFNGAYVVESGLYVDGKVVAPAMGVPPQRLPTADEFLRALQAPDREWRTRYLFITDADALESIIRTSSTARNGEWLTTLAGAAASAEIG